jgi:Ty3 transposon capsid-like protein
MAVRLFKGERFTGESGKDVEEFWEDLEVHVRAQRDLTGDKQLLIIRSALDGNARKWLNQWVEANLQATQAAIKTTFVERYEDRTKSVKAFNKLYTLRQERMTIKELNREFNSLMVNLKPKPADVELRRAYANMLKLEATAE